MFIARGVNRFCPEPKKKKKNSRVIDKSFTLKKKIVRANERFLKSLITN